MTKQTITVNNWKDVFWYLLYLMIGLPMLNYFEKDLKKVSQGKAHIDK